MTDNNVVHVAAAAIFGSDGQLLVSQRAVHVHQGGFWEFPGGKVESGETIEQALERELQEELGIRPTRVSPLIRIPYQYPDKTVLLDVWRVTDYAGEPQGMEGQPLRWVSIAELVAEEFPPANRPIIDALQLPNHYMITGSHQSEDDFLNRLEQALKRGVRLVQFRVKELQGVSYVALAKQALVLCHRFDARLIVNGGVGFAAELNVDGVHLTAEELINTSVEQLRAWRGKWIGASCHNAEELARAIDLGVRYVSISPVQTTATHPQTPPLGWQAFRALVEKSSVPVYALGGMESSMIAEVIESGGQGIAAIREYWHDSP